MSRACVGQAYQSRPITPLPLGVEPTSWQAPTLPHPTAVRDTELASERFRATTLSVIPAPLGSEACERDQAGTHAACNLRPGSEVRDDGHAARDREHEPGAGRPVRRGDRRDPRRTCGYVATHALTRRARGPVHGSRPGPTRALTGTRGAGMTALARAEAR